MKSFRDLQSAASVPSWRAELSVTRTHTRRPRRMKYFPYFLVTFLFSLFPSLFLFSSSDIIIWFKFLRKCD